MKDESSYCSAVSSKADEPLHGTASTFSWLLLIEYDKGFKKDAVGDSGFPPETLSFLNKLKEFGCRTLLIRRGSAHGQKEGFKVIRIRKVGSSDVISTERITDYAQINESLFFNLNSKERLLTYSDSIYLVCVNGKKDQCCAKYGIPVYNELKKHGVENVWMCSHVGGDRFAPSVVHVPSFSYYGRIETKEITAFITATRGGKLYLPRYRGRSTYHFIVQSADFFLRKHLGMLELDSVSFLSRQSLPDNFSKVQFITPVGTYDVTVQTRKSLQKVLSGCSVNRFSNYHYQELISIDKLKSSPI